MKNALAFLFSLLFAQVTWAEDALQYKKGAMAGDYQAQRNWASSLAYGQGIAQNVIEACAWRIIIVSTQHARVGDSDVGNFSSNCASKPVTEAAQALAEKLSPAIPVKKRTIKDDIWILTDEECPGKRCVERFSDFPQVYTKAVAGEVAAMRRLAQCYAKGCENFVRHYDGFMACLWITRTIASVGSAATREDKILSNNTCGIVPDKGKPLVDFMLGQIAKLAAQ